MLIKNAVVLTLDSENTVINNGCVVVENDIITGVYSSEPENYEGIRVNVDKHGGWFLLRMSLHDPLMPLNIESDREGGVSAIAGEVYEALKCFDGLDTSIIAAGIC